MWAPLSGTKESAVAGYGPASKRQYSNPWLSKISIRPAAITPCVNDGEAALLDSGLPVFQRDGEIGRTGVIADKDRYGGNVSTQRLIRTKSIRPQELFGQSAIWLEEKKGTFYQIDCPSSVAETYLARNGDGCR